MPHYFLFNGELKLTAAWMSCVEIPLSTTCLRIEPWDFGGVSFLWDLLWSKDDLLLPSEFLEWTEAVSPESTRIEFWEHSHKFCINRNNQS